MTPWLLALSLASAPPTSRAPVCGASRALEARLVVALGSETRYAPGSEQRARAAWAAIQAELPGDAGVERALQDWLVDKPEAPARLREYRERAARAPADPLAQDLLGRFMPWEGAAVGEAEALFRKTLRLDPGFALAHLDLAELLPEAGKREEAARELRLFAAACPGSHLAAKAALELDDPALAAELAAGLRRALAADQDPAGWSAYSVLWPLEFQAAAKTSARAARQQVAADLVRLRSVADPSLALLKALEEGSGLADDPAGKQWAREQIVARFPASAAADKIESEEFAKTRPYPAAEAGPKAKAEWLRAEVLATAGWVRRRPGNVVHWQERLDALKRLDDTPARDLEEAADGVLAPVREARVGPGTRASLQLRVAEAYVTRGVRLADAPALIERALQDEAAARAAAAATGGDPTSAERAVEEGRRQRGQGSSLLVRAWIALGKPERARAAVERLYAELDALQSAPVRPPQPARGLQGTASAASVLAHLHAHAAARLARAEGKKLDALGQLTRLVKADKSGHVDGPAPVDEARSLWAELGGSEAGFAAWTANPGGASAAGADTEWDSTSRPLPELGLRDLAGKTWTLRDLQGKTTLLVFWASWCGPCKEELPEVQKLAARLAGERDLLVLTVNADQNPGRAQPFLTENKLDLPTLAGYGWATQNFEFLLPRSLVVDRTGTIRRESVGFRRSADWPGRTAALIRELAGGPPAKEACAAAPAR